MLLIDKLARTPLYQQLVEGIEKEIAAGVLQEGEQLPSVREYSVLINANPNTIQKAFGELERAGIIITCPGRGCYIAAGACAAIHTRGQQRLQEMTDLALSLFRSGYTAEELKEALASALDRAQSH